MALVHGFSQTGASWSGVAAELDGDVVCPDVPVAALPEAAARLAGEVGPAAWVGYSMGGRVVLHLALARPDVTRSLVLLGATGGIDDDAERAARRAADETLADRIEAIGGEAFLDEWLAQPMFAGVPRTSEGRVTDPAVLAASLRLAGTGTQAPLWDRLGELAVPVLVLAGERDAKFRALGERLAATIPDARFEVVPGAGHAAHLERPDAFLALVQPWLRAHA